ncbi:DUF4241 domain-containing protein [Burkholderiaceae bacterium DAT-1]|nr:DUF4241 domain-containing protein [Burkholderiaceae bacterium DAT-1]
MNLHTLYPDRWKALANESASWHLPDGTEARMRFFTVEAGQLWLQSGRLVPCDPFASLQWRENGQLELEPGQYRVVVTVADISEAQDGSDCRDAYLSLIVNDQPATHWFFLAALPEDMDYPDDLEDHQFIGIEAAQGAVGFVDADAVERLMPDPALEDWEDWVFDSGEPDAWLAQLEDPDNVAAGIANIRLPNAQNGENIVICGAGFGEGNYPVVGTFTADGHLTAVHIDLMMLPVSPMPEWD